MKQRAIPRLLITLLGLGFIFVGSYEAILGFAGEEAAAVITDIRREGGERSDGRPGRYTYVISYHFTLPGGTDISGFTKNIGDSVYLKADGKATRQVRYFPGFPHLNALEEDTGFGLRQLIFILIGCFLIYFINAKGGGRHGGD